MIPSHRLLAALFTVTLTTFAAHAAPAEYTISDLGTLPGTSRSIATGINSLGQVVGVSYSQSDGTWTNVGALAPLNASYDAGAKSFLYSNGQMTQINPVDGPVNAVNDMGQVVGGHYSSINNSGQYVGSGGSALVYQNQFGLPGQLVSGGTTTTLSFLPLTINDSGQNGQVTDLSDLLHLKGIADSVHALNNLGDVLIAESNMSGSDYVHYILFSPATLRYTDLNILPGGSGITATTMNNKDQVVGTNFLFSNGQITSLQGLLPSTSHWSNLDATGINDAGQIVGQGLIDGQEHAFLMSPQAVPEPSSLVLFGFGFAAIAIRSLLRKD
jgi:probable HAF family extracellular repeat protein